jgi:hypothetical protein
MGHATVLIGVRVLAENKGWGAIKVRRYEVVCEAPSEPKRVLTLETIETLGNGWWVGAEYGMGVNRTKTERLPGLAQAMGSNGGGGKASKEEGNE